MAKGSFLESPESENPKKGTPEEEGRYEEQAEKLRKLNISNKDEGLEWLTTRQSEHLHEEYERAEQQSKLATIDKLTGLPNRLGFEKAVNEMLSRKPAPATEQRKRSQTQPYRFFSVLVLDVNKFKSINDEYGHDMGDIALKEVARYLTENVRGEDIVGRSSEAGDEFFMLLPETTAQDVKKRIEGKSIEIDIGDEGEPAKKIPFTLSGGVKEFKPGEDFAAAIAAADKAMYQAKQDEKMPGNRMAIADSES
jgi:diguanylate cyclase